MKRLTILVLIVWMLVSACADKVPSDTVIVAETEQDHQPNDAESLLENELANEDPDNQDDKSESLTDKNELSDDEADKDAIDSDPTEGTSNGMESFVSDAWSLNLQERFVTVPYNTPTVDANVPQYSWAEDLSDLHNADMYTGFTQGQVDMLNTNGFVVLKENERYPYGKLHQGYESAEYMFNSVLITSDVVLHMYRSYYSESMKALELTVYLPDLELMTYHMGQKIIKDYEAADSEVQEDLKYVYAYMAVAADLLGFPLEMPEEVVALVEPELQRIEAHDGFVMSELLGTKVDYTQYTVRGHYTLHEDLGRYFKTMMWYGNAGFELMSDGKINFDQVTRAAMLTHLTHMDKTNLKLWNGIYELTSLYSGSSDDLNLYDLRDFMMLVYGEDHLTYEAYVDTAYRDKIKANIDTLRKAEIVPKVTDSEMADGIQYRFMGQRFTLDGYIMQSLMEPTLRPIPTAYDVMTAFGSSKAQEILYDYYPTNQQWEDYDATLDEMTNFVNDYTDDEWGENLYSGWLWALKGTVEDQDMTGYPVFMQNNAWSLKNLTAALGSYAELKHDNVLYAKQPVAEMGGDWSDDQTYHYVEPNVTLYSRLLWLTRYTKESLSQYRDVSEDFIEPLNEMEELLSVLETVSVKELQGDIVTDDEFATMEAIGGYIDYINWHYSSLLTAKGIEINQTKTSALISDVATILDAGYLEEATGLPYEIYAICHVNDTTFMAKGFVFSYYEFVSGERLTDDEWALSIGYGPDPDWEDVTTYLGPAYRMIEAMPWTISYVSEEENNVLTESVELLWGE